MPVRRMISFGADTVGAQKDDLRPPDMLVRGVAIPRERLQTAAIRRLAMEIRVRCARLACVKPAGNLLRDSNVRREPLDK